DAVRELAAARLLRTLRDKRLRSARLARVGHGELLRDGRQLSPRVVEKLPVRIFRGAFEFLVREAEIGDFFGTVLRKAVDAHDPAVRGLHYAPFAFPGQRVGVELSQVALGPGLARVFQQVLEGPGKLPRPAHVVSL